jgi:hypothetical protein
MAVYKFTGADVAGLATNANYLAGDKISVASYARTIQALALVSLQNTPAIGDGEWRLYAGAQLLGQGTSVVGLTTGAEVKTPDDFSPINIQIPAGQTISLEVTNLESGVTHSFRAYFLLDRI